MRGISSTVLTVLIENTKSNWIETFESISKLNQLRIIPPEFSLRKEFTKPCGIVMSFGSKKYNNVLWEKGERV